MLDEFCEEAASRQIANYEQQQGERLNDEQREEMAKLLRLTGRVTLPDGELRVGNTIALLGADEDNEEFSTVAFDSSYHYRVRLNQNAVFGLQMNLDFTRTPVLDFSNISNQPTANGSAVVISGLDKTWVRGVSDRLRRFFEERSVSRNWLHAKHAYDVALLLFGYPVGLWASFRISEIVRGAFGIQSSVVHTVVFIYFLVIALYTFRILFNWARWVSPKLEGPSGRPTRPTRQRRLVKGTFGALALAFLYDVLRLLFW